MGLVAGLTMLLTVALSLRAPGSRAQELAAHALPADLAVKETSAAAMQAQTSLLAALATRDPAVRAAAVLAAQDAGRAQDAAWATYLDHSFRRPAEMKLQRVYEESTRRARALGASLVGLNPLDASFAAVLGDERGEAQSAQSALTNLTSQFYEPALVRDANAIVSGINSTRTANYVAYGVLALLFSIIGLMFMRSSRRDDRLLLSEAAAMRTAAHRAELETSLQRGLEMEGSEDGTYDIVRQALATIAIDVPAELLVADSSQSHFRQVLSTAPDADAACRVGGPAQCPVASTGQTRLFHDSTRLDTCPFLRGRDEPVWALCAPVSIAGRTTGVIHVQREVDAPRSLHLASDLELVARKTGERIGVLRVLATNEAQAQVDSLTGLPNRRTLENRAHDLLAHDDSFVVAFADLDLFKAINDTHGHETGDRALRLFARVLRDSVRPRDLPARYGGEEFVVVLPDCSLADARIVAERVRIQLANTLDQGTVPGFTVTIGLAAAEPGESFSEVVARADAAMLQAKTLGRDRVLVAGAAAVTLLADTLLADTPVEVPGPDAQGVHRKGSPRVPAKPAA